MKQVQPTSVIVTSLAEFNPNTGEFDRIAAQVFGYKLQPAKTYEVQTTTDGVNFAPHTTLTNVNSYTYTELITGPVHRVMEV